MTTPTLLALADRPTVRVSPVIVSGCPEAHQVWLDRGVQHFRVGEYLETKQEADAYADMLRRALAAPQVEMVSELPELPEPQKECWIGHDLYSADQMHAYAQAALNARAGGDAKDAELAVLEEYLRMAGEPIGQECCGRGYGGECCGNPEPTFMSSIEVINEMCKRHGEIVAALASQAVGVKS